MLPIDIKWPERVLQDDGALFVTLRTLDELGQFWRENQGRFEFACVGTGVNDPAFLSEYEWVFGTSKSALVRMVMRWDQLGLACEFEDWAKSDPATHAEWFRDRDIDRDSQLEKGLWSGDDERAYQEDCVRRSPESYRGWWQLKNLPAGWSASDWFDNVEELIDFNMPVAEVERMLQEQTFDEWKAGRAQGIHSNDRASIEETINYWRKEKAAGADYYGCENE